MRVLQRVWAASGGQCGKYLAVSMRLQLDGLERHGELVDGVDRPVLEAGESHRPDQGCCYDEAVGVVAVLDQGPQGR